MTALYTSQRLMYLQDKIHDKSNMYRLALTDDEAKLEDMGRLVHAEVKKGFGLW